MNIAQLGIKSLVKLTTSFVPQTQTFLVSTSNLSFYSGWSLSHSVTHVILEHAYAPVTCVCAFATRGYQTLLVGEATQELAGLVSQTLSLS